MNLRLAGKVVPWLLLATVFATAAAARAAPSPFESREPHTGLQTTVLVRYDDDGLPQPVVQVTVPYRSLVFRRRDGVFRAAVRVTVVAQRGRSRVGGGVGQAEAVLPDYRATRGEGQLVCETPVPVRGEGLVTLQVRTEIVGTSLRWSERLTHAPTTGASRVPLYCEAVDWNAESVPGQAALLGPGEDSLRVTCRLRRRPGAVPWPERGVALVLSIRGERDEAQPAVRRRLFVDDPGVSAFGVTCTWSTEGLPFGRLELTGWLELAEPGGEQVVIGGARPFANLHVRWEDEADWRRQVGWLEGRLEGDARQRLLRTPTAQRPAAWRAAWEALAATHGGHSGELERAHLLRIIEADAQFGQFGRGALSDRGRVYIRHGAPDSVERHGDDLSREGQWEIWYYYALRLTFTFYDAHGLGDYRLTSSTGL